MSQTIDNRIVEMRFENAQFEKGVATSMQTLDKLKESLKFEDTAKGLDNLNKSISNVDTSSLSKGVETASKSWSALEVAAITAIANISNRITNLGIQLAKSLSVDQISSGFGKYEQELRAVQTIMNATGESIETVEAELEKLMWYTDETSYEYSNMVDNISKFTAQGIRLEDANSAMQGIANMAGLTGASVQDAAHAMDGFAKAMAAGNMKLQNWKWIQTAHMETVATKQAFIDAAEACGTLERKGNKLYETVKGNEVSVESFTETLKYGWLTADAMMDTFASYASYSDLVKEFQDAYEDLNHVTLTCAQAMDMLADTTDLSQEKISAFQVAAKNAWGDLDDLDDAVYALSNWTEDSAEKAFRAAQEYRTFKDAIDATKDAASSGWKAIFKTVFGNAIESKQLWSMVGDTLYTVFVEPLNTVNQILADWSERGGFEDVLSIVEAGFEAIGSVVSPVKEAIAEVFPMLDGKALSLFTKRLLELIKVLTLNEEAAAGLKNILSALLLPLKGLSYILSAISKVAVGLVITVKFLVERFLSLFATIDLKTKVLNALKTALSLLASTIFILIGTVVTAVNAVVRFAKGFVDLVKSSNLFNYIISSVTRFILTLVNRVKSAVTIFKNWVKTTTILSDALAFCRNLLEKISALLQPMINIVKTAATVILAAVALLINFIVSNVHVVIEFIKHLKELSIFQKIGGWVSSAFNKVKQIFALFASFTDNIKDRISSVGDVIKGLKDRIVSVFSGLKDNNILLSLIQGTLGILNRLIETFKKRLGESFIGRAISNLREKLAGLSPIFAKVGEAVKDFISKLNAGKIVTYAFAGMVIVLGLKLAEVLYTISKFVTNLSNITSSIGMLAKNLNKKFKTSAVVSVAEAVALLAGSLYLLSQVESGKLKEVAIILGALAGGLFILAGAFAVLSKYVTGEGNGMAIAGIFIGLGAALLLVAGALKMANEIKVEDIKSLWIKVGMLATLLGLISGLTLILGRFGTFSMKIGFIALFFIAFGITLKQIVEALMTLSVVDMSRIKDNVLELVGLMIALGVLAYGLGQIRGLSIMAIAASIVGLIAAAFLIKRVIDAYKDVSMDDLKSVLKILGALYGFFIGMSLAFGIINAVISGPVVGSLATNLLKLSASVFLIVGSVYAIIGAIALVSTITEGVDITGAVKVIVGIMGGISLMLIALGVMSKLAGAGTGIFAAALAITAMAGALYLIIGAISLLGLVPVEQLKQGLAAVAVLELLFTALLLAAGTAKGAALAISSIIVAITLLMVGIIVLSNLDTASIISSAFSLALVMAGLSLALKSVVATNWKGALASSLMVIAFIGSITAALKILSDVDFGASLVNAVILGTLMFALSKIFQDLAKASATLMPAAQAAIIMSTVLVVIAGAVAALARFTNIGSAVGAAAILVGTTFLLVKMLEGLAKSVGDIQKAAVAAVIMSSVLLIISGALIVLSRFANADSLIESGVALAGLLAILTVCLVALADSVGPLQKAAVAAVIMSSALLIIAGAFWIMDSLQTAGTSVALLGITLLTIVVALTALSGVAPLAFTAATAIVVVAAALVGIAGAMYIAGAASNLFVTAIDRFANINTTGLQEVFNTFVAFLIVLGSELKIITLASAAILLLSIAFSGLGGSLLILEVGIAALGAGLMVFNVALAALLAILTLTSSVAEKIAATVMVLTDALVYFGSQSEMIMQATVAMASLAKGISLVGLGLVALGIGLATVATPLLVVAASMAMFALSAKCLAAAFVTLDDVNFSVIATGLLMLAGPLGVIGAISVAIVAASVALSTFAVSAFLLGAALAVLNSPLAAFTSNLSALLAIGTDNISSLLTMLTNQVINLGNNSSAIFAAAVSIVELSVAAGLLGIAFGVLAIGINAVLPSLAALMAIDITAMLTMVYSFAQAIDVIGSKLGTIALLDAALLGLSVAFTALGVSLVALSAGLAILGAVVTLLMTLGSIIAAIATAILKACPEIKTAAIKIGHALSEGFKTAIDKYIKPLGNKIVKELQNSIKKASPSMVDTGHVTMAYYQKGLSTKATALMPKTGTNTIAGFLKGITGGLGKVRDSGITTGSAYEAGVRQSLDVHSPSELLAKIANWVIQGFTGGIGSNLDSVRSAGEATGNSFLEGILNKLSGVGGWILEKLGLSDLMNGLSSAIGVSWGKKDYSGNSSYDYDRDYISGYYQKVNQKEVEKAQELAQQMLWDKKLGLDDEDSAGGGGSGKGSGSSAKEEEKKKSVRELIETYKFGADVVDAFNSKYSKSVALFEEQTGVTGIAEKSVDELALRLYKMSEQYQDDLSTSDLKTEDVLAHIKDTFEAQLGNIRSSIASVDIWSEFKENEDPITMDDLLENSEDWLEAIEDWQADLNSLLANGDLSDAMKQYLINLGFEGRDMIGALADASEDELDQFSANFDRFQELQNTIPNNVMATWSASMSGISNVVQQGCESVIESLNTNLSEGLDPDTLTGQVMTNVQNMFSVYKDELANGSEEVPEYSEPVGLNICEGIKQGIEEGRSGVVNAVIDMVREAIEAGEEEAEIESPSKVFAWMGRMMDEGLVKGIYKYQDKVALAGSDLVGTAISSVQDTVGFLSDIINNEFGDPVIKPILDLSDIQSKAGQLSSLLESNRLSASEFQNGGEFDENGAPKYQFIQNNYSPKALSRIDIYRQTKNQFSMMKEVTNR